MTNSEDIAKVLKGTCSGMHRHIHLVNGRAAAAQVYLPALVRAILHAMRKHMIKDYDLSAMESMLSGPVPVAALPNVDLDGYWDDVNGGWLDP